MDEKKKKKNEKKETIDLSTICECFSWLEVLGDGILLFFIGHSVFLVLSIFFFCFCLFFFALQFCHSLFVPSVEGRRIIPTSSH